MSGEGACHRQQDSAGAQCAGQPGGHDGGRGCAKEGLSWHEEQKGDGLNGLESRCEFPASDNTRKEMYTPFSMGEAQSRDISMQIHGTRNRVLLRFKSLIFKEIF
jgi:hypothetical protein